MINSELLAEAIADAKAVRATALANAKAALEEAFAPRFEAMFADKLKEEAEEEEGAEMNEVEAPNQVSGTGGEAKGPSTKAVTKGNPKQPKSGAGDKDFKPVKAGKGPSDVANPSKKVNETAEEGYEEGKVEEAGLTSEDLDEIIKELENEVADEEEGQPVQPVQAGRGGEFGEEPVAPEMGGEGDAEVNAEPGSEVNIDLDPTAVDGEGQPEDGQLPGGMNAGGLEEPEDGIEGQPEAGSEGQPAEMPQFPPKPHKGGEGEEEGINLEELLAALNEEADEDEDDEKKMDEIANHGLPKGVDGQDKSGGVRGYSKSTSNKWIEAGGKNHNISGKGNIGTGATGGKPMQEITKYKVALSESYKTIEFLRAQINEVNLLNAKLLYTNKLFKDFAGILDESYRMKIIENFDLTKSVREVKLAYALLAESLNFGTQNYRIQKVLTAQKPSSTTKTQVKQITEGFASKPVSSTKPSQLITEGNQMALRFKKLAGIKEPKIVIANEKK